jgi:hypothetical protein
MHFVKQLSSAPDDYLFLFANGNVQTVAAWTNGNAHQVTLCGRTVTLTGDPQYIPVSAADTAVRAEAAWMVNVPSATIPCGIASSTKAPAFTVVVRNPFENDVPVSVRTRDEINLQGHFVENAKQTLHAGATTEFHWVGQTPIRRDGMQKSLIAEVSMNGKRSWQRLDFTSNNDLTFQVVALPNGSAAVAVSFPTDETWQGELLVRNGKSTDRYAVGHNGTQHSYTATPSAKNAGSVTANADGFLIPLADQTGTCRLPVRIQVRQQKQLIADVVATLDTPSKLPRRSETTFATPAGLVTRKIALSTVTGNQLTAIPLAKRVLGETPAYTMPAVQIDGDLAEWTTRTPCLLNSASQVARLGSIPWKGVADLSARIWMGWDANNCYLAVQATDDTHVQSQTEGNLWRSDSVQFAMNINNTRYEFACGLSDDGKVKVSEYSPKSGVPTGMRAAVKRVGTLTNYELAIPWSVLNISDPNRQPVTFALLVNDDDGHGRNGWIEWMEGIGWQKQPELYSPVRWQR